MYTYNCKGDTLTHSATVHRNIVDIGFCIFFCLSVYIFVENSLMSLCVAVDNLDERNFVDFFFAFVYIFFFMCTSISYTNIGRLFV